MVATVVLAELLRESQDECMNLDACITCLDGRLLRILNDDCGRSAGLNRSDDVSSRCRSREAESEGARSV